MTQRKAIQITMSSSDRFGDVLYALCNDGTMWAMTRIEGERPDKWVPVHPIPQPEAAQ